MNIRKRSHPVEFQRVTTLVQTAEPPGVNSTAPRPPLLGGDYAVLNQSASTVSGFHMTVCFVSYLTSLCQLCRSKLSNEREDT